MDDSVIGTEVEGYRIQEVLGRGGMGVVYKAKDVALSRAVALKRIDPTLANDEAFLRRFRSEARALARIDSPYIVSVHALRQTDIGLLIVMEYVEGGTLKDLMREGPMDWQTALSIITQMLEALEHAHGAEVIHRDIKPRNIMLSQSGTVKVTDFGLAKVHRPDSQETVTQGVYGTLNYMSPEQVQGGADLDPRSDLYSLGMTIYEMLAGDLPFAEDSSEFTKMRTIVEEELPRPDELRPQVPDGLSALVMKALEKDPDDRFQSAEVMREAFEAFAQKHGDDGSAQSPSDTESPTASSRGRWRVLGGLAALVLLLVGGGYWLFAGEGLLAGGGGSGPSETRFSVSTEPSGATVFLDGRRIGTTPLVDTTLEGSTAQVRVQRAGYVPVDTVAQLEGRQVDLRLPLTRKATPLSVQTEPTDARVYVGDVEAGRAPLSRSVKRDTVRVRAEREGYRPADTLVRLAEVDQARLTLQLDRRRTQTGSPQKEPPQSDPEEEPSPTYGTLTLGAEPSGSVFVDGEPQASSSIQVRTGSHRIRITHPRNGECDTTLTVEEGETEALTCYFEHRVVVRSDPWANVYIDEQNTGESTTHVTKLGAGTAYEVGVRIQSRPFTVTGGTYRRRGAESGEIAGPAEFSGNTKTVTLRPGFERETHILDFHTSESEPDQ